MASAPLNNACKDSDKDEVKGGNATHASLSSSSEVDSLGPFLNNFSLNKSDSNISHYGRRRIRSCYDQIVQKRAKAAIASKLMEGYILKGNGETCSRCKMPLMIQNLDEKADEIESSISKGGVKAADEVELCVICPDLYLEEDPRQERDESCVESSLNQIKEYESELIIHTMKHAEISDECRDDVSHVSHVSHESMNTRGSHGSNGSHVSHESRESLESNESSESNVSQGSIGSNGSNESHTSEDSHVSDEVEEGKVKRDDELDRNSLMKNSFRDDSFDEMTEESFEEDPIEENNSRSDDGQNDERLGYPDMDEADPVRGNSCEDSLEDESCDDNPLIDESDHKGDKVVDDGCEDDISTQVDIDSDQTVKGYDYSLKERLLKVKLRENLGIDENVEIEISCVADSEHSLGTDKEGMDNAEEDGTNAIGKEVGYGDSGMERCQACGMDMPDGQHIGGCSYCTFAQNFNITLRENEGQAEHNVDEEDEEEDVEEEDVSEGNGEGETDSVNSGGKSKEGNLIETKVKAEWNKKDKMPPKSDEDRRVIVKRLIAEFWERNNQETGERIKSKVGPVESEGGISEAGKGIICRRQTGMDPPCHGLDPPSKSVGETGSVDTAKKSQGVSPNSPSYNSMNQVMDVDETRKQLMELDSRFRADIFTEHDTRFPNRIVNRMTTTSSQKNVDNDRQFGSVSGRTGFDHNHFLMSHFHKHAPLPKAKVPFKVKESFGSPLLAQSGFNRPTLEATWKFSNGKNGNELLGSSMKEVTSDKSYSFLTGSSALKEVAFPGVVRKKNSCHPNQLPALQSSTEDDETLGRCSLSAAALARRQHYISVLKAQRNNAERAVATLE